VVEAHGQMLQNGRRLSLTETNHVVSVARSQNCQVFIFGYRQFVEKRHVHNIVFHWDRDTSVGIATGYGLDCPGIESRGKSRGGGNGEV
jgi:hypothetical protein